MLRILRPDVRVAARRRYNRIRLYGALEACLMV